MCVEVIIKYNYSDTDLIPTVLTCLYIVCIDINVSVRTHLTYRGTFQLQRKHQGADQHQRGAQTHLLRTGGDPVRSHGVLTGPSRVRSQAKSNFVECLPP